MVKFSFTVYIPASLPKVWEFFGKFQNLPQWDPNTTAVSIKKHGKPIVGTLYDVKTLWKGEQQTFQYEVIEFEEFKKIKVKGENFMTKTVDEISFSEKYPGTSVTYHADIQLKHVFKDLQKLAKDAETGFNRKSQEMFSKQD